MIVKQECRGRGVTQEAGGRSRLLRLGWCFMDRGPVHIPKLLCNTLNYAGNTMCFHMNSSQESAIFTFLFPPYSSPSFPSRFDIYRKVPKDLTQPTYTGAFSECQSLYC